MRNAQALIRSLRAWRLSSPVWQVVGLSLTFALAVTAVELVVAHGRDVRANGWLLLLFNALLLLLLSGVVSFVTHGLAGRHLRRMAHFAHEELGRGDVPDLTLQRREPAAGDDLSVLMQALNQLHRLKRGRGGSPESELLARQLVEARLQLMVSAFEKSHEAILMTDAGNRIVTTNPAFTRLTGYTMEEVLGHDPKLLSAGMAHPDVFRQMWESLNSKGAWQGELWDRRKDGSIYPKWLSITAVRDTSDAIVNYIAIFSDISERKEAEEKIFHLAHHDSLTGLHNRMSLRMELSQAIARAKMNNQMLAVMFIDLDQFKDINNVYGHDQGDRVLMQVAKRLHRCVRGSDIVGRPGGDEFVVILPTVSKPEVAAKVAEQIRGALEQPYLVAGRQLLSGSSIGVAIYPQDGDDSEELMKCADVAMYQAKAQGRNNVQFYQSSHEEVMRERLRLGHELRQAQKLGQFQLHYQPKFEARSDRLIGLEALLRWEHPELGSVQPERFIPVAEETGLIQSLGNWVLDEACRQMRVWRDQGLPDFGTVAVNLSAHQLGSPGLCDEVAVVLGRHGLPASCLEFEITESMLIQDIDANIRKLEDLRRMGVKLSIDDFGTGYSSLSYLKLLPIDALKLDRSFVHELETDASNVAICISTITLAHNLGLQVIAEGVETEGQRDFLVRQHCDILQGYLLGAAQPASEVFSGMEQRSLD